MVFGQPRSQRPRQKKILFGSDTNYNLGHILVDICEIWQKVLVHGLVKSAYFRSASSESDNK